MTTATTPSDNSLSYISSDGADEAVSIMQDRLVALLDLQLTLKHIHWNVVGPNFIAVHEMLDPQVDSIRLMSDSVAERIATTGGQPLGTPGAITATRSWNDYGINRAAVTDHLTELDDVYTGVITDHRKAASRFSELDPVTEDLFIGQLRDLELFQWFVRAHLQDASGTVNYS
jgi:starvation-inducible DNA-binding protein